MPRSSILNKEFRFVVHQHKAYKAGLHYDLRLETIKNGKHILWSFACRKGIPLKPGEKHLMIMQHDHNIKWLDYEGKYDGDESGGYGAGYLKIWDKGTYKIIKRTKNSMTLEFHGKKLKGIYALIAIDNKNSWIILKARKSYSMDNI